MGEFFVLILQNNFFYDKILLKYKLNLSVKRLKIQVNYLQAAFILSAR